MYAYVRYLKFDNHHFGIFLVKREGYEANQCIELIAVPLNWGWGGVRWEYFQLFCLLPH